MKQVFNSPHGEIQTVPTAQSRYTITTGQSPSPSTPSLSHIRANLEQRSVSACDAMQYILPEIMLYQIAVAIKRLPRAAIIKAVWPPRQQGKRGRAEWDTLFDAVSFDNLHLLFGDDLEGQDKTTYKSQIMESIDSFIKDIQYMDLNPCWTPDHTQARLIVLVSDTKKSNAQIRYERDVRDRTEGTEYRVQRTPGANVLKVQMAR
ncbi:hypothetical protein ABBQ38_006303 [Trebouxia sp. C0009 RCD-2024]